MRPIPCTLTFPLNLIHQRCEAGIDKRLRFCDHIGPFIMVRRCLSP